MTQIGVHEREPVPLTWLINFVAPFRVRVTSTSGGNHVPTSYHYRHRALDVTGAPQELQALMKVALKSAPAFREAFYDPMGQYVKNGTVRAGKIGGHQDHVHLAR